MTKKDQEIISLRKEGLLFRQISENMTARGFPITENYATKRYTLLLKRGLTITPLAFTEGSQLPKPSLPTGVVSEAQLRKKHDKFFIIMTFLNGIPEGNFIEEAQMLKELKLLGKPGYREVLTREEIKPYKGKVDGTVYYGSTKSINKLKTEGVLQ